MLSKATFQLLAKHSSSRMWNLKNSDTDAAVSVCAEWLSRHADQRKLLERWDKLEAFLMKEHNLFDLDERERGAFFEATPLDIIGNRIDELHALNKKSLHQVWKSEATTMQGLISKLLVALALAHPDENRDVHLLLCSILNDIDPNALTQEGWHTHTM
ncbi:MAG: hypothetical protein KDA56_06835 [Hyphomonas sp.]|nr:hypothetical protein [Hyphomonas sp.]